MCSKLFLGAKAPLGPLDEKEKVKAKKFRNSIILPELLDNLRKYASMQYASMQVTKYAGMQVCRYGVMQVCKHRSMQVCKYGNMKVCQY